MDDDKHPAERAAERFAHLVGAMLDPLKRDIEQIRASLGLTNGETRSLLHRVTDAEDRISALEIAVCDTERPKS